MHNPRTRQGKRVLWVVGSSADASGAHSGASHIFPDLLVILILTLQEHFWKLTTDCTDCTDKMRVDSLPSVSSVSSVSSVVEFSEEVSL